MNDEPRNESLNEPRPAMPIVWAILVRMAIILATIFIIFIVVHSFNDDVVWPLAIAFLGPVLVTGVTLLFLRRYPTKFAALLNSGVCLAVVFCLFVFMLLLHSNDCPEYVRRANCISNLKQLQLGLMMYYEDYDGSFPPSESWNEAIYPYTKSLHILSCPTAGDYKIPSYALNGQLIGKNEYTIANREVLVAVFDSILDKNLCGGPELLSFPPRHSGGDNYAFADGHAKWYARDKSTTLEWLPKIQNPKQGKNVQ